MIAAHCEGAKLEWRQVWKRWAGARRVLLKRRYRWIRWDSGSTNVGGRLLGRLIRERHACELSQLGFIARGKAAPSLDTPGAVQGDGQVGSRGLHQTLSSEHVNDIIRECRLCANLVAVLLPRGAILNNQPCHADCTACDVWCPLFPRGGQGAQGSLA